MGGEPGDGAGDEADRGRSGLVVEDLDVGEAGGVIDTDMDGFPADTLDPVAVMAGTAAGDSVAGDVGLPRSEVTSDLWC